MVKTVVNKRERIYAQLPVVSEFNGDKDFHCTAEELEGVCAGI
jgi:hypothetical protein